MPTFDPTLLADFLTLLLIPIAFGLALLLILPSIGREARLKLINLPIDPPTLTLTLRTLGRNMP